MAKKKTDDDDAIKPVNDAYTGMLAISLVALIVGCALLFLDYSQYSDKAPEPPKAPVRIDAKTPQ